MKFKNQKLSNLTDKAKKLIDSPMKKAVITTVAIAALAFHPNPIAFASVSNHTTAYNTINDTHLDTVSSNSIINNLVESKIETAEQPYKNMNLQLDSQIKYNPDQLFQTAANNENTISNLVNALELKVKAAAIVIDGMPVVYLENNKAAEEVIRKIELQYVTEAQLKDFEARSANPNAVLPPLKDKETRILNVSLSKNVSLETESILPEKILTAEQALTLLQKGTLVDTKYLVKDGDVLGSIASSHQLSLAELLALNPGLKDDSVLKINQEINVTIPKPLVEVIVEKEVSQQEAIPFQTEVKENASMPKGDTKTAQDGQNGLRNAVYQIAEKNGAAVSKSLTKQDILKQPVKKIVIKGTKVIPSRGIGSFAWPAAGGYISSNMGYRWGKLHKGIDIARPSSYTIKAADNGVVVSAGWDNGGYGNKIVIDHQNGFTTLYGHLSSVSVRPGQVVERGSAIGVMGSTGDSTGVHLHFEVHKNGSLQNPLSYLSR